jgi:hypothetical protein
MPRGFVFPQCVHVWTGLCDIPPIGPQVCPRTRHRSFMAAPPSYVRIKSVPQMSTDDQSLASGSRLVWVPRHRGLASGLGA